MTKNMTVGNPWKIIISFTIPVLLGNLFQQLYNMVDSIIVGRFLGEHALAAVGATGCINFLVLGFAIGIAQGFGVMIAHTFGAGDYSKLRHYAALSILLGIVISAVLTVVTIVFSRGLLTLMNTPENILDMANTYITIIYVGIPATMFYNIFASILRGIGDSKTPLYFLILSSVINIVLDLFFIIGLHLGVAGAALATILGQAVAALWCMFYMFRKFEILRLTRADFTPDKEGFKRLLVIGLPMALNYSITAIGTMILQSAINMFGTSAVASFTATSKIESICCQTSLSLGTTMSTYCGQNLGAGKFRRILHGMRIGLILCAVFSAVSMTIYAVFAKPLIHLFLSTPSDAVIAFGTRYLFLSGILLFPLSLVFLYRNALQGLNRNLIPLLGGVAEMIARLCVSTIAVKLVSYDGVCIASPLAWVAADILLVTAWIVWRKKIGLPRAEAAE